MLLAVGEEIFPWSCVHYRWGKAQCQAQSGKFGIFWEDFLFLGSFEAGGLGLKIENWKSGRGVETFKCRDTNITRYPCAG